ncbi:unnamed protein product [Durusdinium trenchii]|uniref:Epidermal growth factor receptor substrate 15-like 1 n=3 Tax=Durusdinium trenchii TaxID=1381693 RepID=A0ABP0Q8B6_9DINO
MQPAPQSANGIQYGPQEFEFYQQLFVIANPDGREALDPHVAANFLAASQLPQEILHQVWHFATSLQSYTQDYLMAEGFWLACRLVAWAQNGGLPLDVVHAHQEPPLLPEFPGLQRPPSSLGSRAHSIHGSEHSEMQPVIRLQHAAAVAAAEVAEGRGRSMSPRRVFTPERWAPSRRERRKYAGLFQRSDWDHDGFVQEGILRQIWDLADARTQDGQLDFAEFVCMVHLITCVLRGCGPLGPQLAPQLQQALATLEPLEQLAQEREQSRSRSASPAPAELVQSDMWGDGNSRGRSPSPRRVWTPERWAPSRRERRKYAGLFLRSDTDQDGFVQAGEAKALMERSGLEEGMLRQIWDLADARTQDGQLDFVEFVCMVHLVSCVLRGCGPLGPQLAPQLQQALATLEPLEQLAQEREESRSRSRSASPAPPVAELVKTERLTEMPDFETAFQTDGAEHFGGDFPKDFAKDFAGDFGEFPNDAFGGDGGDWPGEKGKKKKKKDKKEKEKDKDQHKDFGDGGFGDLGDFGAFGDPFGTMGGAPETDLGEDPFRTSGFEPFHPSFPENERTRPLQSVLEKDRHLAQQLRKEVDQLDKDLRRLQALDVELEQLHSQDSKEIEKLRHHSQALQRDLEEGQRRLSELREARSVANQESLTLRRDQDHLLQELKFLRHMAEEEEELIILLQNSNQYLETSCGNLETNSQVLNQIHTDLQRQISTEQEQLDREKKELRDFQGQLDNLKSSGLSSGTPVAEPPAAPKKKPTMILEREGV